MATSYSNSLTHPTAAVHDGRSRPLARFKSFWSQFFATAFRPYRPELHYMRGPGPAWRAKHGMDAPFRLKPRDL